MGGRGALLLGPPRAAPPVPSRWGPGGTRGDGCVPAEKQPPRGPARGPRPAPAVAPPVPGLVGWFRPRPPGALLPQQPHLSRHLHAVSTSVSGRRAGESDRPPTTKRPPRRGRGRGTGRWTSERVIRMHRTSSGKCKLKQQRATPIARQDHGQSPQRRRHRPPARTRGHESPRAPPAGCRRCPARDAVWGRWIQCALAEGPGGRVPRRLFAQRLNAGVRRRLQQLFS